jgi:proteic killer suppression protein
MTIQTYRNKELETLVKSKSARRIDPRLQKRVLRLLDALNSIEKLNDLDIRGIQWHRLGGAMEGRTALHVNGPWRITFRWHEGNAYEVDLEQYH